MQTTACQKLSELVSEFGVEICEDQRRLEALLKDVLSYEHRREIFLLVVSAREGIARQLMSQDSSIPAALLGSRLVQHLCDDLALEEASARWAVECWANALNVQNPFSSVPDCSSPRTRTESGIETVPNGRSRPQGNRNSSAAKESVEAFRTTVAAIESGYSTRSFLLSRDETELARWEHDADAGIPEAQWLMGDCYLEGIGGRLDDAIARQWFQAACDSGLAWGGITFGTICLQGIGGEADIATGVSVLRAAADAGEPAAKLRLAGYYSNCEGKLGQQKARKLLLEAADAKYSGAMYALAMDLLCEEPEGVCESTHVMKLIEDAANQGHGAAKVYLAKILLGDVSQYRISTDAAKAMQLLHEASAMGDLTAITILERHNVNNYRTVRDNAVGAKMVLIPAARFLMGSRAGGVTHEKQYHDESPPHSVLMSRNFFLSKTVVTQAQYRAVMGKNPSKHKWSLFDKGQRPVERVGWHDAIEFCNRLSVREGCSCYYGIEGKQVKIIGGNGYRLPTEAEWELACRSGKSTHWSWGSDERVASQFGAMGIDLISASTHVVGSYACNDFGLFDMHGGVWEWCWDYYSEDFYTTSPSIDPTGPLSGIKRVARGGSYWEPPMNCRSAMREGYDPEKRDQDLGFRIAKSAGT